MYCRCGVTLYGSASEGLCSECYPLSKATAVRQDREVDAKRVAQDEESGPDLAVRP